MILEWRDVKLGRWRALVSGVLIGRVDKKLNLIALPKKDIVYNLIIKNKFVS